MVHFISKTYFKKQEELMEALKQQLQVRSYNEMLTFTEHKVIQ